MHDVSHSTIHSLLLSDDIEVINRSSGEDAMQPPLRMVCGDCLRSVELMVDDPYGSDSKCPFCGGMIDHRLSEIETREYKPEPGGGPPAGELLTWTERWSKGTLGTLGRFQLRELLGDGGFGEVYQAFDPRLDRDVALKVLKQANPGERVMERFFREARAAARLDHPNIVAVLDAGHEAGRCWIAYQYVPGRTLANHREQRKVDMTAAARITRD